MGVIKHPCGAIKTPTGELNLHTTYSTLEGCLLNTLFLTVHVSDQGVGAVLSQKNESGQDHLVSYYSRKLLPMEQRYSTMEKELLAINLTSAFRVYLPGRHFQIITDHRSLEWLDQWKETNS